MIGDRKFKISLVLFTLLTTILVCSLMFTSVVFADYEDIQNDVNAIVNFNQQIANNYVNTYSYTSTGINYVMDGWNLVNNHKYFIKLVADNLSSHNTLAYRNSSGSAEILFDFDNLTESNYFNIFTCTIDSSKLYVYMRSGTLNISNFMLIDLTFMFGSDNEPNLQQCRDLFVSDYYLYSSGTAIYLTSMFSYAQGLSDAYSEVITDVVNYSAYSSAYIDSSINNANAFVNKYIDYEVYNGSLIQFRGYLSIPLNQVCSAGTQININVNGYPDMGGAGGDSLWVGIWYNNGFVPIGKLSGYHNNDDIITSFYLPFDTNTIILSVSSNDDYFVFYDVGKWIGDLLISNARLDVQTLITSAQQTAVNNRDEYWKDYYTTGAGYQSIYSIGYNAGLEHENIYTFGNLMSAVIEAPLFAVLNIFNFEFLGYNMKNFITLLLTMCVLIAIVNLFLGGK